MAIHAPGAILVSLFLTIIFIIGCRSSQTNKSKSFKGSLAGTIVLKEGNFMPTIGTPSGSISKFVKRELAIYPITNIKETKAEGMFFSEFKTELLKKINSSKSGHFKMKLRPGKYSVFTVEPQGLFANRFDGNGNINVVEIKSSAVSNMNIIIDYNAAY